MKSASLLTMFGVICGFGCLAHGPSFAQGRVLATEQIDALVKTDLTSCAPTSGQTGGVQPFGGAQPALSGHISPASIIPSRNAVAFATNRITKTLNGIWQGKVLGDTGEVGVDYFWIIDALKNNDALIIAQRSGKVSTPGPAPNAVRTAPKFSYLMCAHEGFVPSKDVPQLHEFTKVSDDITGAQKIIEDATGQTFSNTQSTGAQSPGEDGQNINAT